MTYLLANGAVEACSQNSDGQLGNGTTTDSLKPVRVKGLPSSPVTSISAGPSSSTALLKNGQVWGWGNNKAGQLGNGTTKNVNKLPVEATALPTGVTFTYVATGGDHSLGLDSAGDVYAWGNDGRGQLGDAGNTDEGDPGTAVLVPVKVLTGASLVSAPANDSVAALNWALRISPWRRPTKSPRHSTP